MTIKADEHLHVAMDLHGKAMLDYLNGRHDAAVIMHRDDGFSYPPIMAARWFYENGIPNLDSRALALCRGRILNVGAASGTHSLLLEDKGLDVLSLDASACAVEVMTRRNVRNPMLADINSLVTDPFDTILLLCGIGVVGTLEGLKRFLVSARAHLSKNGILITDCTHPRADTLEVSQRYCDQLVARGKYEGERTLRFQYQDSMGPWFEWLAVSPEILEAHARKAGFDFEVVFSELGRTLCALKPSESEAHTFASGVDD